MFFVKKNFTLIAILLLALVLRVWGNDFGRPFQLHPGEVRQVESALRIAFEGKNSILAGDWSILNPKFFFYPYFLTYLLAGVIKLFQFGYEALNAVVPNLKPFTMLAKQDFYVIAHIVSALFGTATVFVVYLLGKLLHSKKMGLVSAFLLAVMFLHTKDSHYFTGDVPATFFIITALYFFLRSRKHIVLSSLFLGFGVACKYYPVILLPLLVFGFWVKGTRKVGSLIRVGFLVCAVSLGVFFVTNPFTILDYQTFSTQMAESSARSKWGNIGYSDPNLLHYFYNQDHSFFEPFFVQNNLVNQVSVPLLIAFAIGIWVVLAKKEKEYWWLAGFALIHFVFFARYKTHIIRWLIPLAPVIALFASRSLVWLRKKTSLIPAVLAFCVIVAPTLYSTIKFNQVMTRQDTRSQAYNWVLKNIPDEATVLIEYFSIADLFWKNNKFYSIEHARYNVGGVIANADVPTWQEVKNSVQPDYVIINEQHKEKYTTAGSQYFWPKTTTSWIEFYNNLANQEEEVVAFIPDGSNFRPGPVIRVYKVDFDTVGDEGMDIDTPLPEGIIEVTSNSAGVTRN